MSKLAPAIRRHFVAVPHISVAIIVATCFFGWSRAALAAGPDPSTDATAAAGPGAAAIPATQPASSATMKGTNGADQIWNWHVQNTDIVQSDPGFPAKYSGPASLNSTGNVKETVSADLFAGVRLWRGAEAHMDGLMWQGFGLSTTHGIESFPDGDAYKKGTKIPNFMFARLFLRQTIGLGGEQEAVPDDQLTLAGKQDISRLTFTIGQFTPLDVVDHNTYAQDSHTQFMSWALMANLTWDYGQDTIGYTTGIAVELNQPNWALRYICFSMPPYQNFQNVGSGNSGDDQYLTWPARGRYGEFFHSWAMASEFERRYRIDAHPGAIRFLAFLNEGSMASYHAATAILLAKGPEADISPAQAYQYKYGFGLNWEQEAAKNVGMFSRLGWNDGQTQAMEFSDANWTASIGASVKGEEWQRPGDTFGLAGIISGASRAQQNFRAAGGVGILDGDGALSYGSEKVLETYYDLPIWETVHAAVDYQFISNPAFNRDRGPVSVFLGRLHWEL
jgi:high affinity Mn2+ porin